MYTNVGKKIQIIGQVLGWMLLAAGVIVMFWQTSLDNPLVGLGALFAGVVGYMSSWFIYAFGQLVDDVHAMCSDKEAPAVPNDELPEL